MYGSVGPRGITKVPRGVCSRFGVGILSHLLIYIYTLPDIDLTNSTPQDDIYCRLIMVGRIERRPGVDRVYKGYITYFTKVNQTPGLL